MLKIKLVCWLSLFLLVLPSVVLAQQPDTSFLSNINHLLEAVLFFDLSFGALNFMGPAPLGGVAELKVVKIPLVLVVLTFGALFFTFYFRFINIRGFVHGLLVTSGKFDHEDHDGDISHFKALTSALSATIGLGNIAGVAIAIQLGGPGAAFWMVAIALFGMSAKFTSCTLSQLYRQINTDGSVSGGPMYYLDLGIKENYPRFALVGKSLAVLYAAFIVVATFGGGGMFQVNQSVEAINASFGLDGSWNLLFGLLISGVVGLVIFGGIKKIAVATVTIVPVMFSVYMIAGLYVLATNITEIIPALGLIISSALNPDALYGGFFGTLVIGLQRGAFSNEAGVGTASIVHSAAKTDQPIREGLVAMLGPFVDTAVVCMMTALVVITTGTWNNPEIVEAGSNIGVSITAAAFGSVIPWFPYVLTVVILLFAYSTMIAWCYYGERGCLYLFNHFGHKTGARSILVFRSLFLIAIVVGAVITLSEVIDFTDFTFLSLAIPNVVGMVLLAPVIKKRLIKYEAEYLQ